MQLQMIPTHFLLIWNMCRNQVLAAELPKLSCCQCDWYHIRQVLSPFCSLFVRNINLELWKMSLFNNYKVFQTSPFFERTFLGLFIYVRRHRREMSKGHWGAISVTGSICISNVFQLWTFFLHIFRFWWEFCLPLLRNKSMINEHDVLGLTLIFCTLL